MANRGCVNGTLDDSKYSSPMPFIGLYISLATSVCFLAILFDIISGFRSRKRWLPCRFFSLNSVTLTLLAIAAKIPADLTTKMPSAYDQLSKLSGTTLICVSMGFLMPSIGIHRESENWSNMLALSILIVTIFVNVCVQLHTGVIVLFRMEHIIILCCMTILLIALFCSTVDIHSQKRASVSQNKDLLRFRNGTMLQRVKLSYLYAYQSNPQFELCKDMDSILVPALCIISSIALLQAALRSFTRSIFLCDGLSDYQWSTWVILVTQVATIVIGSLGTCFRFVTLALHMKPETFGLNWAFKDINVMRKNPLLHNGIAARIGTAIKVTYIVVACIELVIIFLSIIAIEMWKWCCGRFCNSEESDNDDIRDILLLIQPGEEELEEWTLRMGARDMKKWMELNKNNAPNHNLKRLLSKSPSLEDPLLNHFRICGNKASSLSVVLLARIATVCMPPTVGSSLSAAISEAFEIVHFVEKKMIYHSSVSKKQSKLAKAAFEGPNSRKDLQKIFKIHHTEELQSNLSLDQAIAVIKKLKDALPSDLVREALFRIELFILQRSYNSIEELYDFIEQLFVEILNEILCQLPLAIFINITESNPEDFEDVIRFSLKLLCKVESLEAFVQWSYPLGTGIRNLISNRN